MKPLFKIEVRVRDERFENSLRKIFFIREDLQEAAVLGWRTILEKHGGSMCWVKSDGSRAMLGIFLPVGHPSHTYLVNKGRVPADQHYWQLATKVVNVSERVLFSTCVPKEQKTDYILFPGVYYHGRN